MTFYSPFAFVFLPLIPAIIILYLLKQRFPEHTVSSLYLWRQVIRDMEANAPWQKLKKNILMILQIAAMLLLILALANPFLNAIGGKHGTVVLAVDASMSMQATDVKPSRFEAARKKAAELVSSLQPGTRVTLISVGQSAVIEENLSSDKNRVLEKLKSMKVTYGTADFDDAADLISSLVRQNQGAKVFVLGDEKFNIPGVNAEFISFAGKADNFAVTLLSHSRTGKEITVLSRIANYGSEDAVVPVSLYTDGKVFDAKEVSIKSGETANVYWNGIPEGTLLIECRIDSEDRLAADNAAWDAVDPPAAAKVALVSEKNIFIEKILSLTEGIEYYRINPADAEGLKGYNLYIYDGVMPEVLPDDGNIMVVNPPENNYFKVSGDTGSPNVTGSSHELFKHVHDYSFVVGKARMVEVPAWGEEVLGSDAGTLMFAGQLDKRRVFVVGFDLHYSDIPLKPAFPILMTDVLRWLLPSRVSNLDDVYPGQSVELNIDPRAEKVRVIAPSGNAVEVAPPFPVKPFTATGEIGCYTVEQEWDGGREYRYFAVNPPAEKESDLIPEKAVAEQGEDESGNMPGESARPGFRLQGMLLWLVIILLVAEWWVYSNGA